MRTGEKNMKSENLPVHKPDPALWDMIEQNLGNLEAGEALHQSLAHLPVHEPGPETWTHIEKKLRKTLVLLPGKKLTRYILYPALLILLLTGIYLAYKPDYTALTMINKQHGIPDYGHPVLSKSGFRHTEKTIRQSNKGKGNENSPVSAGENITNSKNGSETMIQDLQGSEPEVPGKYITGPEPEKIINIAVNTVWNDHPIYIKSLKPYPPPVFLPAYKINFNIQQVNHIIPQRYRNLPAPFRYSAGINSGFAYMYHTRLKTSSGPDFRIELNGSVNFSDFFIQSGLGLTFSHDKGNISTDYLQEIIKGTYTRVDSILYHFDSVSGSITREYITSDITITDSLLNNYRKSIFNTYTYFRVPILFGYEARYNKIGYYFKTGPVISILASEKTENPLLNNPGIRVINTESDIHRRININYQFYFAIGMNYYLNDRFSLCIEPSCSRYLNPVYDFRLLKKDRIYSLELKTGISYHFYNRRQ